MLKVVCFVLENLTRKAIKKVYWITFDGIVSFWVLAMHFIKFFTMIFDPSDWLCVPSQSKIVNVTAFNMISKKKKKNESKSLQKHISCDCECTLGGKKYN